MSGRISSFESLTAGLAVFLLLFAGGCSLGPERKIREIDLPAAWPENEAMSVEYHDDYIQWWTRFKDPVLDRLVARAVKNNTDVRLQAARVREARARLGFAEAEQLPTVGVQAEALRRQQSDSATGVPQGTGVTRNLFSIAGILGYEIDIWGRLAREREAAEAVVLENRFTREAVALSVISDVVVTYFNLRAAQKELEITRKTASNQEETYNLERVRYEAGQTDELVLRQAESQMETTKAMIPVNIRQVKTLSGALGVLVGLSPAEIIDDTGITPGSLEDIQHPMPVPRVLPSDLMERRPDIRSAGAGVDAAGAAIGIARAGRFPRLNLATLLGTAAISTGDLFGSSARTWEIGAQSTGPLLDFGRSASRVATAEAQYAQAEIQYEATVRAAFNDVRDALILYQSAVDRQEAIERQLNTVRRTRNLAQIRYREGMVGFIEFLDAERALFDSKKNMNLAARDKFTAAATLFKALGGGWSPEEFALEK